MSKKGWRSIGSRIRNRLSRRSRSREANVNASSRPPESVTESKMSSAEPVRNQDPDWSKKTEFRSTLSLRGSTTIKIWFESIDEIGVRFSLNLADGTLSERENWAPDVEMPGGDLHDPEPLSVWGIDSLDGSIHIVMHVDAFDSLHIDGEPVEKHEEPEVVALLNKVTNVTVRDLWISPEGKLS